MLLPELPKIFSLSISTVSVDVLWWIFMFVFIVVAFVTIVLYFHWVRYGIRNKNVLLAALIYTLTTVAALAVISGSVYYYGQSLV